MPENQRRVSAGVIPGFEIKDHIDEFMSGGSIECVESCSYDMRVGTIFNGLERISHASPEEKRVIQIQPGGFIYIYTEEELNLHTDVSATAYAINSLSSRGLLVLNAGHVDPGFTGPLTVTAWNLNTQPQTIFIGDRIITVLFNRLEIPAIPFSKNVPREQREKSYSRHVSTEASRGLGELIQTNIESPLASKNDVENLKKEFGFWKSQGFSTVIAVVGLILAVVSVFNNGGSVQVFNGPTPVPAVPVSAVPAPAVPVPAAPATQNTK